MRKSSVALGLAILSGSALAQSSITVYGVMDSAAARGIGSLTTRNGLVSGSNTTSRIGFRGIEDLGGGLQAGFYLEAQVFTDTGEGQPTNTNNTPGGVTSGSGLTFARRSTVSLLGSWGELRAGRDFVAHYRNRVEADPFGNAGVGSIQPFVGSIVGVTSTRVSNMVGYYLPANIGGLYGQLQVYAGENGPGGTGESGRLGYILGKANLSLAMGRTKYPTTATAGDVRIKNAAFQYDFGFAKFMTGYYLDKVASTRPVTAKGFTIGGIVPYDVMDFRFAYSSYGTTAGTNPEARKISLGTVYNLSRRTALYGTYAHVSNSRGSAVALNNSTTAPNMNSSGFDVGIRHLF